MQLTRSHVVILALLFFILTIAAVFTWSVMTISESELLEQSQANQALGSNHTPQQYTDLEGRQIELDSHIGEVTVVFSWASWCPSCKKQLQVLSGISSDFATEPVSVLAINRAEQGTTVERYLKSVDGLANVTFVLDPDDHYYDATDGYAMPETVVYDKQGEISYHGYGNMKESEIRAAISAALAVE